MQAVNIFVNGSCAKLDETFNVTYDSNLWSKSLLVIFLKQALFAGICTWLYFYRKLCQKHAWKYCSHLLVFKKSLEWYFWMWFQHTTDTQTCVLFFWIRELKWTRKLLKIISLPSCWLPWQVYLHSQISFL